MADCPSMAKCPFFNDKMKESPELANLLKMKLCRGDNSTCARFVVLRVKGRESVPSDLRPLDAVRAREIIAQRT